MAALAGGGGWREGWAAGGAVPGLLSSSGAERLAGPASSRATRPALGALPRAHPFACSAAGIADGLKLTPPGIPGRTAPRQQQTLIESGAPRLAARFQRPSCDADCRNQMLRCGPACTRPMTGLHGATHASSKQWAGIGPSAPNCATARCYNLIDTAGSPCPGGGSKFRPPRSLSPLQC